VLFLSCYGDEGMSTRPIGPQEQSDHILHPPFDLRPGLCPVQADQQAEVVAALEQRAEVFGGGARLRNAQLAALVGVQQQALQLGENASGDRKSTRLNS